MRTLVLGGIRSGKSRWAETAFDPEGPVRYVATGPVAGADSAWAARVGAHRGRRPATWETVETADVAAQLRTVPHTATLVDDLGGWLTTALDRRGWDDGSVDGDVDELVSAVRDFSAPLVLVSPEVGLTVVPATASGRRFADELGALNQHLAQCCDRVVLVVAGLPVWIKPTEVS
ncbi:MAG TPA: bifunctional adenosylcobinamide kinase/adenosylcobinamide-phosphate guanylyltransferase [Mycobacterium sp.]|nr:bifunctional adenosylcobinamide kinase/adenosylcobinamide-phosphate guanylyltransferase [Mycobacterium sp.]